MSTENQINYNTDLLKAEMQDLSKLADSFGNKLVTSLSGAVLHGRQLSEVFRGLALSMANQALSQAVKPIGNLVGNLFSNLLAPSSTPSLAGGIENSQVLFSMQNASEFAGAAFSNLSMPVSRNIQMPAASRMGSGSAAQVTVNISTPDVQGFRQSQSQVAAMMARAIEKGQRNQ